MALASGVLQASYLLLQAASADSRAAVCLLAAPPTKVPNFVPTGPAAVTVLTSGAPAPRSHSGATAPLLEVGALRGPGQSAPVAALRADGEVPAPWGPPDAPGACKELYATAAQHHVDPFGVLELPSLWPASSRSRVRPRPLPFGPAYNSSNFDIFLKSSYVVLVRRSHEKSVRPIPCRPDIVGALAGHPNTSRSVWRTAGSANPPLNSAFTILQSLRARGER